METKGQGRLLAGVGKVEITNREVGPVNDPLYVRALVLRGGDATVVMVAVDAVAIAEIGSIRNEYLANVRAHLKRDLNIEAESVLIHASHCHGVVCADVEQRTVQAVKEAWGNLVPVRIGAGVGHEELVRAECRLADECWNRCGGAEGSARQRKCRDRLKLKSGKEADVRHAYSLAPDEQIEEIGQVDPEIGILRVDTENGETLAVVYNFACHPIQGVPSKGNTADITGFSSRVIEENLSDGTVALFLQGCGADINPVQYKDVHSPRDGEPHGNMLGLSTLKALRKIQSGDEGELKVVREILAVPKEDLTQAIEVLEAEQTRLLQSLRGTSLNLKSFLNLLVKYRLSPEFPSSDAGRYLHEKKMGRDGLEKLDEENRMLMDRYEENIYTMEALTRAQANLSLMRRHQARYEASGEKTVDVEVMGVRIGSFVLVTFPGELPVEIGLGIKKRSPHGLTFVSGATNGYLYYTSTVEQMENRGWAQEDSDCYVAPEWQKLFEDTEAGPSVLGQSPTSLSRIAGEGMTERRGLHGDVGGRRVGLHGDVEEGRFRQGGLW